MIDGLEKKGARAPRRLGKSAHEQLSIWVRKGNGEGGKGPRKNWPNQTTCMLQGHSNFTSEVPKMYIEYTNTSVSRQTRHKRLLGQPNPSFYSILRSTQPTIRSTHPTKKTPEDTPASAVKRRIYNTTHLRAGRDERGVPLVVPAPRGPQTVSAVDVYPLSQQPVHRRSVIVRGRGADRQPLWVVPG